MSDTEPVSIRILDRDYTVGVQPAQREGLLAAARLLEKRMHEIRGGNRMVAMERVAVLAALSVVLLAWVLWRLLRIISRRRLNPDHE